MNKLYHLLIWSLLVKLLFTSGNIYINFVSNDNHLFGWDKTHNSKGKKYYIAGY